MILSDKNIELRLLDESMLETLREWRNSSAVYQFMEYQEIISKEGQRKWFQNLSKEHNFYFVICADSKYLGMIHIGDVNFNTGTAESGMFIADESYRGTGIAFKVSLLILEFAFERLCLSELFAKVKNDNKMARDYNSMLGFQEVQPLNDFFSQWSLKKNDFELKKSFLKQLTA